MAIIIQLNTASVHGNRYPDRFLVGLIVTIFQECNLAIYVSKVFHMFIFIEPIILLFKIRDVIKDINPHLFLKIFYILITNVIQRGTLVLYNKASKICRNRDVNL